MMVSLLYHIVGNKDFRFVRINFQSLLPVFLENEVTQNF